MSPMERNFTNKRIKKIFERFGKIRLICSLCVFFEIHDYFVILVYNGITNRICRTTCKRRAVDFKIIT